MAAASWPSSGTARADRVLLRALLVFRAGGLVEVASVVTLDWRHYRSLAAVLALVGVLALESMVLVLAVTAALAGGYALSAIAMHHDAPLNVLPNVVTYFANTAVAWAVVREVRWGARSFDASQEQAVTDAEDLARERERARHARLLHDHVLQTFESLVRLPAAAWDSRDCLAASDKAPSRNRA